MPWKTDESGEKKYELSLYCKEELPTWDEMYNEFYLKKLFEYDPNNPDHQVMDPYWNVPRRKILLAWACNQLNKMMFEDGVDVAKFIKDKYGIRFNYIYFILVDGSLIEEGKFLPECVVDLIGTDYPPGIYSCKLPSTKQLSIFQTNHPRIDIDELDTPIEIISVATTIVGVSIATPEETIETIKFILKDIINYFENGIGWKDAEGNMLPVDSCSKTCEGAGFDPAL